MALAPGTKLGSYEVSGLLGKGGMGEVYRARDSKLGRDVAVKTLPAEFATDPDRVARLEREARLLATLNHPNVAGIYGLEESGDARFLVLELVEGETLAERLAHRRLPVEQALRIALQIASALEAAHAKGVIHRDLKPSNIKITADGTVKVLDFGLAKDTGPASSIADFTHSPTLSLTATAQGVILGTAGYMSPQQARGEAVDKQADIWAFGCILFEMLSGRQTWTGRSAMDVIAALVAREPDWTQLPANLHPRVRFALERCLEKEVDGRYRDIADARVEIAKALADPTGVTVKATAQARRPATVVWASAAAAVVGIAAAGAAAWYWSSRPAVRQPVARFSADLEALPVLPGAAAGTSTAAAASIPPIPIVAVSRDGMRWAFSTIRQIYLRNLGEAEARPVQGASAQGVFAPAFSPDGEWRVYVE
jgi:predicted Ser/Thr protein kinase